MTARQVLIIVAALLATAIGLSFGGAVPTASAQSIQVLSADPPSGEQGSVSLNVLIKGKGFKNGAIAHFFVHNTDPEAPPDTGGVSVKSTRFVGSTQLVATIDIADTATLADFDIVVQNADGRTGKGTEPLFSVTARTDSLIGVFRDAGGDKVTSDGSPYVSVGSNTTVKVTDARAGGEGGDLIFSFTEQSGRSIGLDFTDVLRASPGGFVPPGPDDPVVSLSFRTMLSGGAEPRINFNTMTHNQTALVRLFFDVWTASGDHYALRGHPNYPNTGTSVAGPVQVTAVDVHCETSDGCDGYVEQWILEPVEFTDSAFQLVRFVRQKGNLPYLRQDFGDFRLPFRITFGPA